jgi:hypothetical protein
MAIRFEKISPGMTLYERSKMRAGNTTLRTICEWPVRIISLDAAKREAVVSWNGNPARTWGERRLRALFDWSMHGEGAVIERGIMGTVVKVTKKKAVKS